MTRITLVLTACLALTVAGTAPAAAAEPPAGHWTGAIDVPNAPLDITVDLQKSADGRWIGEIDIPAQELAGFPLGAIEVDGPSVSFAMPGVPGEPVFRGTLTTGEAGARLAGTLHQGGAQMPFRMTRAGEPEIEAPSATEPLPPELARALPGRWEGTLEVPGSGTLRVALVLAVDDEGRPTATFDSPDQGQTGLPVTRVTVEGSTLRAELAFAGAAFEGTLNEARTAISGTWQQGGGSLPLTLAKAGAASGTAFPPAAPEEVGLGGLS